MKTVKVELTMERDDGRCFIKTLEGADAQQWQEWVDSVCALAWAHGENPPWGQLRWVEWEADADYGLFPSIIVTRLSQEGRHNSLLF